jgi:hypothetical protein
MALKVVASNTMLEGRKAHLNLRPAFAILAKTGPVLTGLTTIRDLRTVLDKDLLPIEMMLELLDAPV